MEREEEEAAREERERAPEPRTSEAAEGDALEQAAPVRPNEDDRPTTVGDRPEADALEQARGVDGDEEDAERR